MLQHAILDLKVFAYNAISVSICINLYKFLKDFFIYLLFKAISSDGRPFIHSICIQCYIIICIDFDQFT